MPKKMRDQQIIQEEKNRILSEALKLIESDGWEGLSMRKLAVKCGITATTIYNYFLNKDELYLTILVVGFSKLYESLEKSMAEVSDPYKRLEAGIYEYIRFGLEETGYYNIMFTYNLPKYTEYFGKQEESLAMNERKWAMKVIGLFISITNDIALLNPRIKELNTNTFVTEIWCMLHGFVSLCNSQVMQTIEEDIQSIKNNLIARIVDIFKS